MSLEAIMQQEVFKAKDRLLVLVGEIKGNLDKAIEILTLLVKMKNMM